MFSFQIHIWRYQRLSWFSCFMVWPMMVVAALWGLLGGVAIPLLMGTDGSMGWLTGPMGAIFAAASIATARRGALPGEPLEAKRIIPGR